MINESAAGATSLPDWVAAVAREANEATDQRLGTLARIDAASRARGIESVELFEVVTLGRVCRDEQSIRNTGQSGFGMLTSTSSHGCVVLGHDNLEVECHGLALTHIDGLNHFGVNGTWHGRIPIGDAASPSIADWASSGVVTRGVFLDIPAVRSSEWVDENFPVTGSDLEAAVQAAGVTLAEGDALLIYMGRDRYEAAGHKLEPLTISRAMRPGIGEDGARWLAKQRISAIAWDFLDAHHPAEVPHPVHFLIWALGLALVDNCDFARARSLVTSKQKHTGLLVVSPLNVPGGTGSVVNPTYVV